MRINKFQLTKLVQRGYNHENMNIYSPKYKLEEFKYKLNNLKIQLRKYGLSENKAKYFCIGYPKTGTTTLNSCFKILGFRTIKLYEYFIEWYQKNDEINKILVDSFFSKSIENNEMFSDWPFHVIYKELDKKYPNSKFILTIRKNKETWERSLKNHIRNNKKNPIQKIWRQKKLLLYDYDNHIKEIKEYFKDRPKDLLILCFEDGDGWEKLCNFLGKNILDIPFPHENKEIKKF